MFRAAFVAASLILVGAVGGCIKRVEMITVFPDGSVNELSQIDGDPADFESDTAIPSEQAGWTVREEKEVDNEGKETVTQTAQIWIDACDALPGTFAPADAPYADRALQFPTTLKIEQRPEGTYYHFRRVYQARPWARVEYWRERIFADDAIKKISQKDPETLTDEERSKLAGALILFEGAKAGELVDQAAEAFGPDFPQDAWLAARRAATGVYDTDALLPRVVEVFQSPDAGEQFGAMDQELRTRVADNISAVLTEQGIAARQVTAFLDELEASRVELEMTEDLGDESWDNIFLQMPGRIIGHNSFVEKEAQQVNLDDKSDDEVCEPELAELAKVMRDRGVKAGYEMISWSFDGKAVRDRDVILMATSFVPAESR